MKFYKILSILTSILFIYLFLTLLFWTESFYTDLGLPVSDTANILGRRASMLMLGMAVLLLLSLKESLSSMRVVVALTSAVVFFGFASMGILEFIKGSVNSSILQAIVIEFLIATGYLIFCLKNRKVRTT